LNHSLSPGTLKNFNVRLQDCNPLRLAINGFFSTPRALRTVRLVT
jgi:hypothetical protein